MKATRRKSFDVHRRFGKFPNLLLVYVWSVGDSPVAYCLTYPQAEEIAREMGWTETDSWQKGEDGSARLWNEASKSQVGGASGASSDDDARALEEKRSSGPSLKVPPERLNEAPAMLVGLVEQVRVTSLRVNARRNVL